MLIEPRRRAHNTHGIEQTLEQVGWVGVCIGADACFRWVIARVDKFLCNVPDISPGHATCITAPVAASARRHEAATSRALIQATCGWTVAVDVVACAGILTSRFCRCAPTVSTSPVWRPQRMHLPPLFVQRMRDGLVNCAGCKWEKQPASLGRVVQSNNENTNANRSEWWSHCVHCFCSWPMPVRARVRVR